MNRISSIGMERRRADDFLGPVASTTYGVGSPTFFPTLGAVPSVLVVSAFGVSINEDVVDEEIDEGVGEGTDEGVDEGTDEVLDEGPSEEVDAEAMDEIAFVALNPVLVTELILRVVLAMLSFAELNVSVSNSTNTPSAPLHPYLKPSRAHLKSMRHGYESPGSLWQHIQLVQEKQPCGPQGCSMEAHNVVEGEAGLSKRTCSAPARYIWRGKRKLGT
jgi:hypothetical protein